MYKKELCKYIYIEQYGSDHVVEKKRVNHSVSLRVFFVKRGKESERKGKNEREKAKGRE